MIYHEEKMNLFDVPEEYFLVHCISADFALGAGIAVEFEKRFNLKEQLKERYKGYTDFWDIVDPNKYGDCLYANGVMNLVTKRRYFDKPKYDSMYAALRAMKKLCSQYKIKKLAMPKIGCGLDKLRWDIVSRLIKKTFEDTNVEILVCIK